MQFRDDDIVIPVLIWTEANYERAVALSDDEMPKTFAEWQEKVRIIKRSVPPGAIIIDIEADPDEVAAWCRANGRQVTTQDRAAFAADTFRRNHGV